jgi:hypothetical protein
MTAGELTGSGSAMYSVDVGGTSVTGRSNSVGTGSASVTVHGGGLGVLVITAMGRMGETGCEGTEWESETSVRCLTSSGARGTRRLAMTAGERTGSSSAMYSVDVGGMSVTGRSNGVRTGSASVTVHGRGLGLVLITAGGRMGETGCEGTEWQSETSVSCLTSSGRMGTRRVAMTAGDQGGSLTRVMSFDASRLSASRQRNAAGTGSAFVTVHGAGLGHAALTGMMRAGQTGCEGTEWESETSVRCLVGHGSRGTRRVTVTAGELSGSMTEALSVDVTGMSAMGQGQCSRDGVSMGDGTRGRAGAAGAYRSCEDRRDGMRGDGVGVGDVGAVPDILGGHRDAAGGDDNGRAVRERQRHVLGGCGRLERDRTIQRCGDGVSVGDGTRGRAWACFVYSGGADGGDGMRGDGVGVGDVGAVPDIFWG